MFHLSAGGAVRAREFPRAVARGNYLVTKKKNAHTLSQHRRVGRFAVMVGTWLPSRHEIQKFNKSAASTNCSMVSIYWGSRMLCFSGVGVVSLFCSGVWWCPGCVFGDVLVCRGVVLWGFWWRGGCVFW